MRRFLHDNGLSVVLATMFLVFWIAQSLVGHHEYNQDQREHGQSQITYSQYLRTGAFVEATAENWESEFLQMFFYVLLTAFLVQKARLNPGGPIRMKTSLRKRPRSLSPVLFAQEDGSSSCTNTHCLWLSSPSSWSPLLSTEWAVRASTARNSLSTVNLL
jgi:hypothetical protein